MQTQPDFGFAGGMPNSPAPGGGFKGGAVAGEAQPHGPERETAGAP